VSRQVGWTAVRILITVAIFAYVLRDFDGQAAGAALRGFSLRSVAILVGLLVVDRAVMLARWVQLMRTTTDLPLGELTRIFLVSSFLGSFLPAGVGGDAARAVSVSRHTNKPGAAVASVLVDRLFGLLAVAVSGGVGVIVARDLASKNLYLLTLGASAVLLIGCLGALNADRLTAWVLPARWHHWTPVRLLIKLSAELSAYRQHPGVLWQVGVLSIVVQVTRIVLAWVIGRSLGIALPLDYYFVFMPLNILIILIPISLGGFGLPQGAMVWSTEPFGVSATQALLLSTLFVLAGPLSNLPGALLYLAGRRPRLLEDQGRY
jgi:uncharacterized membrane protein YbhN (UPF0104 family)